MSDRLQWYRNRSHRLHRHFLDAGCQILHWFAVFDECESEAFLVTVVKTGNGDLEQVRLITPKDTVLVISQPLRGEPRERARLLLDLTTELLSQQKGKRVPFPTVVIPKPKTGDHKGGQNGETRETRQTP
jgi:hypothetical protein